MTPERESRAGVFGGVFEQIFFPYLAVDLVRLCDGLRSTPRGPSSIAIPLGGLDDERREALAASMHGLLRKLEVPDGAFVMLARATPIVDAGLADAFVAMALEPGAFAISERGDHLVWDEQSLWPVAYSTLFEQLIGILRTHSQLVRERREQLPGGRVLGEYARLMPTHLHYAVASLGAWLGGAINVQYFSYFATQPQLARPEINRDYAARIGYPAADATALDESGLVALPAALVGPLLAAQGDNTVFGSIGINEVNVANPPVLAQPAALPGLLMDKYYRASLTARPLGEHAFYGRSDVLRDHYRGFYDSLEPASLVRCKHYCAPVLDVDDVGSMRAIVETIPEHDEPGLFFRGQPRLFTLGRAESVRRLLFGGSCAREPSLTTSASRRAGFDYDTLHFALRHFLEMRLLGGDPASEVVEAWQAQLASPACELDYALMALAQHYGLPSHGLDVTTDLDVALWFATNALTVAEGSASYRVMEDADWPTSPDQWPVVFVHQIVTHSIRPSLQDCRELDAFGFRALRPARQRARFFLGGHSDHQNRLAESLVCAFRIPPGTRADGLEFDELFPSPDQDPGYRAMLDFAGFAGLDGDAGVLRFHA